ncbi:hypothetical protein BZA05DRAFT_385512 [Tricharina praecox]|uniref:uncharacterized protein n=1 Tax=Tricharina praecox TaxID=43433 RepID=UPI00221F7780|nr:uncharacterized protein BZA05DRAFT_385512 [Tricharina praecox]KAI5858002.1 hypothetical protein BZA05DRAFT_385512 [Tricharina praecox]
MPPVDTDAGLGGISTQGDDVEMSGVTDTPDVATPVEVKTQMAPVVSVTTITATVRGAETAPEVSGSASPPAPAMKSPRIGLVAPEVVVEQVAGHMVEQLEESHPQIARNDVEDETATDVAETVAEPTQRVPSPPADTSVLEIASEPDATPLPTRRATSPRITADILEAATPTEIDQAPTQTSTCESMNEPEPETTASISNASPPPVNANVPDPANETDTPNAGPPLANTNISDAPPAPTPSATFPLIDTEISDAPPTPTLSTPSPLAKATSSEIGTIAELEQAQALIPITKASKDFSAAPIRHATPAPLDSANVPEFPNQPETVSIRSVTPPFNTANMPEFATPTQPTNRDLRNIILAAASSVQAQFHHGSVPPSPVVEPGALHELDDFGTPGRRRSSAVGGIAGLEELRNREAVESDRFDQLIQATKFGGDDDSTPVVDAFLRLDFEDGNVYYIRNPSVVFGRAEGSAAGYYSHIGPDGSTIIETGPRGFGRTTSSGLTSMKREKKKRKKKKDEVGVSGKTQSIASESALSRRGPEFAQPPRFRDPFGFADMVEVEEPVIHLPLSNASMGDSAALPLRKNISRRHARLFYNTQKHRFELEIMGKNGAFVDEEYVQAGTTIVVEEKGMKVQIGGISFNVIVPEIPLRQESVEEEEEEEEEEPVVAPPPKFTGGKGKMNYNFQDESGNEDYSENDEDLEMEDVDAGPDSGGEGSIENDSGQESDEDEEAEDDGGSGGDADEEGDQDESSDEDELEDSPSPEPTKPIRPRPMKSIVDIRKREQELQRDRERIKELQRQLKEKEREKAEAEAEALRTEHEELEQKREKERQREIAREKERERIREEKRKKKLAEKAAETQRLKEQKQKERESRAAKEQEKERERERKKQQKLHLPQPPQQPAARRESKLILPTISSGKSTPVRQSPVPTQVERAEPRRPASALLLPTLTSIPLLETSNQPPSLPQQQQPLPPSPPLPPPAPPAPQQQSQQPIQQQHYQEPTMPYSHDYDIHPHQEMLYQQPLVQQQLQPMNQHQMYPATSAIDPALYANHNHNQLVPSMVHDPNMLMAYHQPVMESKPRKEKAAPRPKKLRSPSPEINEADLAPELLIKPNVSYVVMIHEAILNSADKVLSLPQIYKAIETKYPYYKFKVQTQGWQSSVRHNLGQHKAFYKVDRAGKGWLWGVVEGVSIEKEKKGNAAKQTMPGYDGMQSPDGRGAHLQNGQMMGHMGAPPPNFHQQPNYQVTNGMQQPMMQMPLPPLPPQQVPLPPSYMPAKQHTQLSGSSTQSSSRAFEAPIPMPTAGNQQSEQKSDVKQVISVLTRIIAQRQAQASTDPNSAKTLEQLKNFLAQLASGKSSPAALATVSSLVSSLNRPDASVPKASPTSVAPRAASPPDPSMSLGSPPLPQSMSTPVSASPTPGQIAGKAPVKAPVKLTPGVTFANLAQHIKHMSPEERAEWTRKLLELKQQKAAAAAAKAQSPTNNTPLTVVAPMTPRPTTAGKAPVSTVKSPSPAGTAPAPPHPTPPHPTTAGKAPVGLGAGKRPVGAGKMPLKSPQITDAIKNMSPEMIQQYLAKVKANQAMKRPLESSSSAADSGEPPAKKVDVGAKE